MLSDGDDSRDSAGGDWFWSVTEASELKVGATVVIVGVFWSLEVWVVLLDISGVCVLLLLLLVPVVVISWGPFCSTIEMGSLISGSTRTGGTSDEVEVIADSVDTVANSDELAVVDSSGV